MEELILDLEIMSNIYQAQFHNLKIARQHIIEDQKPVPGPKISTGDLVLSHQQIVHAQIQNGLSCVQNTWKQG